MIIDDVFIVCYNKHTKKYRVKHAFQLFEYTIFWKWTDDKHADVADFDLEAEARSFAKTIKEADDWSEV